MLVYVFKVGKHYMHNFRRGTVITLDLIHMSFIKSHFDTEKTYRLTVW